MDLEKLRRYAAPAALVVTGLVGATFWFGDVDESYMQELAARGEVPPPGYDRLCDELAAVRRQWMPREREREVERIGRRASSLQAPILWVLAHTRHPLYEETARLAAMVGMQAAYPLLESAAHSGRPTTRVVALQTADQLQPWPLEEIAGLLHGESDPALLVGVLELCQGRDPRPVGEIVELLESEAPTVRQAALAALPKELPETAVRSLLLWMSFGGEESDLALRALTGSIGDPDVRQRLIEQLADASPKAKLEILAALGAAGEPIPVAASVWAMVVDPARDVELRVAALRCLQRTDSCDLAAVRQELKSLPPPVRLEAVQSLIAAGDREGLAELVRLGDESADARRLLAKLSGIRIHRGMAAYREWFENLTEVPAMPPR